MRRLLAYLIMMLTAIGVIVFNVQSVLENTNDAMEFGRGTELVYSITKREKDNYDSNKYPNLNNASEDSLELKNIDIASKVMDRLDTAGVRNADVQVVQGDPDTNVGYELRVTISPLSDTELNNVKEILRHTGSLSIGTFGDDFLYSEEESSEFFNTDDIATLVYDGTTPYPALNVLSSEAFDKLSSEATTAGENHANDTVPGEEQPETSTEEGDEDTTSSVRGTTLYLWMNKTTEDTFDKAYGVNDTPIVQEVKDKVLAEINVSDFDSTNMRLLIRTDKDGNAFTISTARAFVNALNSEDYGFDIEYLYQNSVAPAFGTGVINTCYLIVGLAILAVGILLVLLFGISGLTGAVTLALSGFTSLWLISLLGFEFSVASIAGLFVALALSFFLSANYFHQVWLEAKTKENLEKANREGYRKSFFIGLDTTAVLLVLSLFGFLFATGSFQTFFGTLMIGTIVSYILTNFLNKWATYWLVKDSNKSAVPYFKLFQGKGKEKETEYVSTKKGHFSHVVMPIVGIASIALLAISLPISNALGGTGFHAFNNSGSYSEGYTLSISYTTELQRYETLETSQRFLLYLEEIGKGENDTPQFIAVSSEDSIPTPSDAPMFVYYPETASFNSVERSDDKGETYYENYFSVDVDRDLNTLSISSEQTLVNYISESIRNNSYTLAEDNNVIVRPGQDPHFVSSSLIVGAYKLQPTNVYHSSVNLFLLVFLLPVFVAVYVLVRYGILAGLSGLVGGELYAALLVGLLSSSQVPFNSYSAFGLLAGFALSLLLFVPMIGRNKILLKERGIRQSATAEQRAEITNHEARLALPIALSTSASLAILFLSLFFLNVQTVPLAAIGLVSALLVPAFLVFFLLPLYHLLSIHINFRKVRSLYQKHREKRGLAKAKAAKDGIVYVDEDSPHETIVPGLNDFVF